MRFLFVSVFMCLCAVCLLDCVLVCVFVCLFACLFACVLVFVVSLFRSFVGLGCC